MPKYCRTYKIMCHSMRCLDCDCAQVEATRLEAEAVRSVKLTASGKEVNSFPDGEKDRTPSKKPAEKPTNKPASSAGSSSSVPKPAWEAFGAHRDHQPIRRDAIIIVAITCGLAFLAGGVTLTFLLIREPAGSETNTLADAAPLNESLPHETPNVSSMATTEAEGEDEALEALTRAADEARVRRQVAAAATTAPPPVANGVPALPTFPDKRTLEEILNILPGQNSMDERVTRFYNRQKPIEQPEFEKLEAHRIRSNELRESGDIPAAAKELQAAVASNPNYYEGFNNLGNLYSESGNFAAAQPIYTRGLNVEPQSSYLHYNIGINSFRLGNYEDAYTRMKFVLTLDPDDEEAYIVAGNAAKRAKEYALAEQTFLELIRLNPENAYGFYNLALLYQELGQNSVARPYFAQAIQLNPALKSNNQNES